ncbi:MAG: rhomboid family intramembrane serine protease [Chitinophagaceae bacterium]|nr:rhomboid family intramembrane serine protease [Chitinophagaceae bacterium]
MSIRSSLQRFHIPTYDKNAVVQIIAYSGVGFIGVHLVWITLIVYAVPEAQSYDLTFRYIGMGSKDIIAERWWTILTYGWCYPGFWRWLSNMLWLYAFGNVVQNLIGYKQVIPIFLYSLLLGGLTFFGIQFFPFATMNNNTLVLGAQAGVVGLMAAALTLVPKNRIYLSEYFSFPLWVLSAVFAILMLLDTAFEPAKVSLLLAGAIAGMAYVKLLQSGYQPGIWAYRLYAKIDKKINPNDLPKQIRIKTTREDEVDKILDKINDYGFDKLTKAEKDLLRETNR